MGTPACLVSLSGEETRMQTCREGRPWAGPGRRQTSTRREASEESKPATPCPQAFGLQSHPFLSSSEPRSPWSSVVAALANRERAPCKLPCHLPSVQLCLPRGIGKDTHRVSAPPLDIRTSSPGILMTKRNCSHVQGSFLHPPTGGGLPASSTAFHYHNQSPPPPPEQPTPQFRPKSFGSCLAP